MTCPIHRIADAAGTLAMILKLVYGEIVDVSVQMKKVEMRSIFRKVPVPDQYDSQRHIRPDQNGSLEKSVWSGSHWSGS